MQRGAYQPAGIELGAREQLLAATHRAGGWATGWSALALYGVVDFDPELACWVAVDKQRRVRGVDFIVQRQVLAQSDLRTVRHVPCVGPFLAVCDYARRVQGLRLLDAIDELRRAGWISLPRLLAQARNLGKHRGAVVVRDLFAQGLLNQDGEAERRLARALRPVGLRPLWGAEIIRGVMADACLPASSLVPEFDSDKWHLQGRWGLDGARRGTLEADGWAFTIVRWKELSAHPDEVAQRIRRLHDQRRKDGLGRPPGWLPYRAGRQFGGR